jgi:nitroreductase
VATLDLTVDELLTTTRNVRKRLDLRRPVERSIIEDCLRIATQAPNGSNNQEWEWIVVDDPAVRKEIAALHREGLATFVELSAKNASVSRNHDIGRNDRRTEISASVAYLIEHLHEVPALVIPTIRTPARLEGQNVFFQASVWGSVIQAAWSFMLALRSRGLGSSWTTLQLWREAETASLLGIPYPEYTQVCLLPVAYTVGTDFRPAQRRPPADILHWNTW